MMKNKLKKMTLALATTAAFAATPAHAVPFGITSASFTPGTGYGTDANEAGGTLLDVRFSTTGIFASQSFALNTAGQSTTFSFGSVNLQEPNSHSGITAAETDNLGVTAQFTFTNPLGITQNILATGTAVTGSVSDAAADYTLTWAPMQISFGTGGLFEIAMNTLTFRGMGSQTQTATITLLQLPSERVAVPEPSSVALLGLGLLGFVATRRKQSKHEQA